MAENEDLVIHSPEGKYVCRNWNDFRENWLEHGLLFVNAILDSDSGEWKTCRRWIARVNPALFKVLEKTCGGKWSRWSRPYLLGAFFNMDEDALDRANGESAADDAVRRFVASVRIVLGDGDADAKKEAAWQLQDFLLGNDSSLGFLPPLMREQERADWAGQYPREKKVQAAVTSIGSEMTLTLPGGAEMVFCWCPATTSEEWKRISGGKDYFLMGSPKSEKGRSGDERRHKVTLTQGFWMGKYQVTQRQWESVMGTNPSYFKGADRPVECVSWDDCQEFIQKVNAGGSAAVALPTEAQWEYACRAGTPTPFSFGSALNGDKANCDGTEPYGTMAKGRYRTETAPVGSYDPNDWGLCDMHGNVWEWCADWYGDYGGDATDPTGPASGSTRVMRGGGWDSLARFCRSASRNYNNPSNEDIYLGFRLCCPAGL